MLASTLKLYPSWNVKKSPIPLRSRLYNIEPIGIGTPYVESLTGYVARLAEQHCVTARKLILTEIAPLMGIRTELSDYQAENISQVFGIDVRRSALNGTGLMASNLVDALSTLTLRNDLHFLTLICWAQVLPHRGLLRHQRAWCPKCYQQWRDDDKSIYEPLLWSINVAVICPYHHNRLLERCPHCHQHMSVISGNFLPGHCGKCGQWLGSTRNKTVATSYIESEPERNWQLDIVNNLGEIIAATPTLKSPPNRNRISYAISTYINQVSGTNIAAVAPQFGIEQATLSSWCKGKTIPQLEKLLQLTHFLEISLLCFLTQEVLFANCNNDCRQQKKAQLKKPRKPYKRLDLERKQVLNVVLQEIVKEDPPPSLQDVALRLRYRPLVLQHHFPSLSEEIKLRHADYRKVCRHKKNQPVLEAAIHEVPPPSLSEITRRLGYKNSSYLSKYFPSLSREISRRYKEYLKASGIEKRERIRQEIETVVLMLHESGKKPTRRRVCELLKQPGVMLNQYARNTLREMQRALGYDL